MTSIKPVALIGTFKYICLGLFQSNSSLVVKLLSLYITVLIIITFFVTVILVKKYNKQYRKCIREFVKSTPVLLFLSDREGQGH